MSSKYVLLVLLLMICINHSVSWRRRRRRRCRVDCQVTHWSSWSTCSATQCGHWGTQQRSRTVQIHPNCGGRGCPSLLETVPCQGNSPVDCRVTRWSSWSACSAVLCGQSGTRQRSRTVQMHPNCGGTGCPPLLDTAPCQGPSLVDCQLSSWSTWSTCSVACGGSQASTRHIITNEQCGGTPCSSTLSKRRPCNLTHCLNQGTLVDGKCSCSPSYYGSCCQYNGGWILKKYSVNAKIDP